MRYVSFFLYVPSSFSVSVRLVSFCVEPQHFDNEIDFAVSENLEGMKVDNIKSPKIVIFSSVGHSVIILASATRLRVLSQQQHLHKRLHHHLYLCARLFFC